MTHRIPREIARRVVTENLDAYFRKESEKYGYDGPIPAYGALPGGILADRICERIADLLPETFADELLDRVADRIAEKLMEERKKNNDGNDHAINNE